MKKEHKYLKDFGATNEYVTSPDKSKNPLSPSFYFFRNLLRIVLYSNRQAKKGIYDDINWVNSSIDVVDSLEHSGIRLHFYGMDNFRNIDSPLIFAANHMSTLETMALPSIIHQTKKVVYVIKEELANYPLFGPIAKARDPILVGRENPREDLKIVLEEGSKKIEAGKSIIIFPQRTRSLFFDQSAFNSLGVKLAKKNNIPVVPVALMTDAWGNGKIVKEVGKIDPSKEVKIFFGEAMKISGNGSEEHQRTVDFIAQKFHEWGREEIVKK